MTSFLCPCYAQSKSDFCVLKNGALVVHALIIRLVIAADDAHPPVAVLKIPLNRLLDAVFELRLRLPAEFVVNLRRVDGVTAVMALAVRDVLNQVLALAEFLEDGLDDIDIRAFIVSADVVDFADTALLQDEVDGMAVILDIEPVADILAIAVDRQLLVGQRIDDHQRNELFREMIRAVVVRAARNRRRQLVRAVVSHDQEVRAGLRSRIRARRLEVRLFRKEQVRTVERQIAVDFIGRNLMIAVNAVFAAGIEQHTRADDIRLQENLRILNRAVDMRLRCEIDDNIRLLLLKNAINRLAVRDIRTDELEVLLLHRALKRLKVARIRQLIHTDNAVRRMLLEHIVNKIRTNKAGTAGHDNIHISIPPIAKQHKESLLRRFLSISIIYDTKGFFPLFFYFYFLICP